MFGGLADKHETTGDGMDESADAFQALVDGIVAEQAAGRMRREDPQALALYIWATVHGVAMLALDGLLPAPMTSDALALLAIERLHAGIDP